MDLRTATQAGDTSGPTAKVSIKSQYARCKYSFDKLLQDLKTSNDKVITQRILGEFGRFRVKKKC